LNIFHFLIIEIFTTNSYSLIQQTQERHYQHQQQQQQLQQRQQKQLDVNIRKDQLFVNEINDKISNEHDEKHRQMFTKLMTSPVPLIAGVASTTTPTTMTKSIKPTMRTLIVVGGRGSSGQSGTSTGGNIKSYNEKFVDISKLEQLDNQLGGDDFLTINGSNPILKNMYFGTDNLTTVTYQAGSVAQLPCTVFYLGDHTTVSLKVLVAIKTPTFIHLNRFK